MPQSEIQRKIIEVLDVSPTINIEEEIRRRVEFLAEYALSIPNCKGFVLGISGGQDSTLAGKLCQLASERMLDQRPGCHFFAVRLPYGEQIDETDALDAIDFIKPDQASVIQIKPAVDELVREIELATGIAVSDFDKGNIKARVRMTTQYALAAARNLIVVGTDHAAEAVTGFFTKFGDGAADIMPLSGLNKSQGQQILQRLGASEHLWQKTPTADLLDDSPGMSDEEALGISYPEIDSYLEGKEISPNTARQLEEKFFVSQHKRNAPVKITDSWWKDEYKYN